MASIWKHPESRYWVACYTDETGRQRKRSTRLTSRSNALLAARRIENACRDKRAGMGGGLPGNRKKVADNRRSSLGGKGGGDAVGAFAGEGAGTGGAKKSSAKLRDVAKAAGVSIMTVSLALRNHPKLPVGTRNRIQGIAAKLGYRPDPNIGRLMERVRSGKASAAGTVLAYLTTCEAHFDWRNKPTQRDYHDGAAQRARELGYQLEEFWLRAPRMTEQRLVNILRNRGIDGVIVAPLPSPDYLFRNFSWEYFSAVELGYSQLGIVLHRCCNQQVASMTLLLRRLHAAGYRRIGLAVGPGEDERVNNHWRAAYLSNQSIFGDLRETPIYFGDKTDWSRAGLQRWLRRVGPDAVVTVGVDVQRWLAELGLDTPGDIALANVDLNETMPDITGINQNALQVGAAAVDLLLSQMRTNERGVPAVPRTLMVDGHFVQGATSRPESAPENLVQV
ncbi:MAG TPA: LacI family DNA-binding transcriptional regulator [Rariglobus sp.]